MSSEHTRGYTARDLAEQAFAATVLPEEMSPTGYALLLDETQTFTQQIMDLIDKDQAFEITRGEEAIAALDLKSGVYPDADRYYESKSPFHKVRRKLVAQGLVDKGQARMVTNGLSNIAATVAERLPTLQHLTNRSITQDPKTKDLILDRGRTLSTHGGKSGRNKSLRDVY